MKSVSHLNSEQCHNATEASAGAQSCVIGTGALGFGLPSFGQRAAYEDARALRAKRVQVELQLPRRTSGRLDAAVLTFGVACMGLFVCPGAIHLT